MIWYVGNISAILPHVRYEAETQADYDLDSYIVQYPGFILWFDFDNKTT